MLIHGYVTKDGEPAPEDIHIRIYSPRGELVGCAETVKNEDATIYRFTHVFGSELDNEFGMKPGEPLRFTVSGVDSVDSNPALVEWSASPFTSTQVDLNYTMNLPSGFNKAAEFDGNTSYVKVPSAQYLPNVSNDFTIELWLKYAGNISGFIDADNYILVKASEDYRDFDFILTQEPMEIGGEGPLYFFIREKEESGEFSVFRVRSQTHIEINQWYHVAIVKENLRLRLFLNGNLDAENQLERNPTINNNFPIFIGTLFTFDGELLAPYAGLIDELRISDTARYTKPFAPPKAPLPIDGNTLALYRFDGDTTDSSGYERHGIPHGNLQFIDSTVPTEDIKPVSSSLITLQNNKISVQGVVSEAYFQMFGLEAMVKQRGGTWRLL